MQNTSISRQREKSDTENLNMSRRDMLRKIYSSHVYDRHNLHIVNFPMSFFFHKKLFLSYFSFRKYLKNF